MKRFLAAILIVFLLMGFVPQGQPAAADAYYQNSSPEEKAKILLDKLTPEEKVGQLFLITFKGRDVGSNSQIYDLIVNRHIGGVLLSNQNDNFSAPETTVNDAYQLNVDLQTAKWNASQTTMKDPVTKNDFVPTYIPLYIAISQEGDLYPNDQIINGTTALPNLMAIGATWDPKYAEQVGQILGSELSALGFNMSFSPALDVSDVLNLEGDDLGTRTFGGDPYWVGEMGKSYIKGIHTGSGGRMVVISKHFPGRGSADRPPESEVATVRKSLEQLKQIELAPFFSVTGNATTKEESTDGLLISHIRYQGFQGNIRATTKPVSLDQTALDLLMGLSQFSTWRKDGGLMVSDDLGSQGIRRFYDPLGTSFDIRQVSRNAILAGNDLLFIDNFLSTGDPDKYTSIVRTLEFFSQKYREDSSFAKRVDASVERLLTSKYKIYPDFTQENVLPTAEGLNNIGKSGQVTLEIAQKAASLISPDAVELNSVLPNPPKLQEKIVFFTDVIPEKQCSKCAEQTVLNVNALQSAVMKLYGPQAGAQVFNYRLSSYSFLDLSNYLDNNKSDLPKLEEDLSGANWVVFSILNLSADRPESQALKRLLSERVEILRNKNVIVFAFDAPYYLDSTDISKLTAYYVLYSKTQEFIDLAARILFQEYVPGGDSSPVSVAGIGYDLIAATAPDPKQVIPLYLDTSLISAFPSGGPPEGTMEPTPVPTFKIGDTLPLITGVIYDQNLHPVPDGTVVKFIFTSGGESGTVQQVETVTTQGVARSSFRIQNPGLLEIRVVSDPATASDILRLDVPADEAVAVTAIAPTPIITETPTPTATHVTPTITPTPTPVVEKPERAAEVDWLFCMMLAWLDCYLVYLIGRKKISVRWGVRWGLTTLLGGVFAYLYTISGLLGSGALINSIGLGGKLLGVLMGNLLGWGSGWWWWSRAVQKPRKKSG